MTIRVRHKAFLRLSLLIFSSLFLSADCEFDLSCNVLVASSNGTVPKEHYRKCILQSMSIKSDGTQYPIADFSNFTQEEFNDVMTVTNERNLVQYNMERLFGGNFLVRNSHLTNITIGFFIPKKVHQQSFVVEDNWDLKIINVTTLTNVSVDANVNISMLISVKNNKMLSEESIQELTTIEYLNKESYIQQAGECDFKGVPLKAFQDLQYCQYTVGDLKISANTDLEYTSDNMVLKEIRACLYIQNSKIDNLDFLINVNISKNCQSHVLTGNENLCIHPAQLHNWNKTFNEHLTYKDNSKCEGICNSNYFMENKERTCVIIEGNVIINSTRDGDDLSFLNGVKEIKGRLVIHNTNRTKVDFFPNLKTVNDSVFKDTQGFGTIEIMYNTLLENVSFPALEQVIVSKDNMNKIYIKQNGENHLSESVRKYFEEKFGKDSVTISAPQPPPPPARSTQQEEEEAEEERKRKAKESDTGKTIGIAAGVVIGVLLLLFFTVGLPIAIFVGCRRKKNFIKNQRMYCLVDPSPVDVQRFLVVKYIKPLPWMKDAQAVISKNVKKISQYTKALDNKRMADFNTLFYKNSDAVAPIFSRNDSVITGEDTVIPENKKPLHFIRIYDKKKGCPSNCAYKDYGNKDKQNNKDKSKTHPKQCETKCECVDVGVKCSNGFAYGIRMESNVKEWSPIEKERNHYKWSEYYTLPTVFEETSESTMTRMMRLSSYMIEQEEAWLKQEEIAVKTGITSKHIKLTSKERKKMKKLKSNIKKVPVTKCTSMYYILSVRNFEGEELDKFEELPVNQKSPLFIRHVFKYYGDEDKTFFLDNMIYVHMNCPSGKLVSNYTLQDFITLCERTAEAIDETSKGTMQVTMKDVNVRIIGQILGDFESLRKGLCHESVNQIEGEHPICNVKHVFLGNYVGPNGPNLHVLCLLFALKCRYPKNYVLLRGVMEWEEMSDISGLKKEVVTRFHSDATDDVKPVQACDAIMNVFSKLPFTCKVGENLLCSNAGIAPRMKDDLSTKLPITHLVPDTLAFNLMFAQPNYTVKRYFDNVEQGAGYYFGDEAMNDALEALECIALICTKNLSTGYGVFGLNDRLMYSICGTNTPGGRIAQVEFDEYGLMHIQVINV